MSYDPDSLDGAEQLSRFACERSYYRPSDMSAKEKAFLPDRDGEVSVFRIDDLTQPELWAIGDEACAARGKPAVASLELPVAGVSGLGLVVVIDEPPVRHAAVRQWPTEDKRLELQQRLADLATVRVRAP